MQYGSSLWEFEVYGEGRVEQSTAVEQTAEEQQCRILFRYEDGHFRILTPDRHIYTIDGKRIK